MRKKWIPVLGVAAALIIVAAGVWLLRFRPGLEPTPASPTAAPREDALTEARFAELREAMVEQTIIARDIENPEVLAAMRTAPRHRFVPIDYLDEAYADHPLPIGFGQTISQPFIVAWMTELLNLQPGEKVLEIGTGSGYQAAILSELPGVEVYSIEIVPELARKATRLLEELGYGDVHLQQGDGYYGWEAYAPFDAIIVTAAPDHLPQPLVQQLAPGGSIVIPIGPPGGYQTLWHFVNEPDGLKAYTLGGVSFVPLTGTGTGIPAPSPIP
ncbi:MAG: protein-L-isoaspartate(D-aspartate) O-methyltransferase [Anaerolineae bacterium]|nr:protein-L-isoaspartate(D-aspartate) O-methyltransferase [Anaerolineae bacterium]